MVKFILLIFAFSFLTLKSQSHFTKLDGPFGGTILQVETNNYDVLFLISMEYSSSFDYSPIDYAFYKSDNLGETWEKITELQITHFKIDNYNNIYGIYKNEGTGKIHLVKSIDNGTTWKSLDFGNTSFSPNRIYIDSYNNIYLHNFANIIKSVDEGLSWEEIPLIPEDAYLLMSLFVNDSLDIFIGTVGADIYKLPSSSSVWEKIYDTQNYERMRSIACDENGNIYAAMRGTIIKSTDDGNSWEDIADSTILNNQFYEVLPLPNNIIISCSLSGYYKSEDSGDHWVASDDIYNNHTEFYDITVTSGNLIFAATRKRGLLKSSNLGQTWSESSTGIQNYDIFSAQVTKSGSIIAATRTGFYLKEKHASKWDKKLDYLGGIDAFYKVDFYYDMKENIIAAFPLGSHSISIDGGENWNTINGNLNIYNIYFLGVDKQNNYYAYNYIEDILYRSSNYGIEWNVVLNIDKTPKLGFDSINNIYIATSGNGISKSTDDGKTFTRIAENIAYPEENNITQLKILKNDKIYFIDNSFRLFKVNEDNLSSIFITENLNIEVTCLIESNNILYIGTKNAGVLYSVDEGETWSSLEIGVQLPEVKTLSANNSVLIINTIRGIYQIDYGVLLANKKNAILENLILYQNYPNPFNPTTTISFELPANSFVKLKLYDIMGKEIKEIFSGYKQAGFNKVEFDSNNLASGVYFYRLFSNNFSQTRKMILLK